MNFKHLLHGKIISESCHAKLPLHLKNHYSSTHLPATHTVAVDDNDSTNFLFK